MQVHIKATVDKEREGDDQEVIEVLSREDTLKYVMTLEGSKVNLQK